MKLYVLVGDDWSNWEKAKPEDFIVSLEVAKAAAVAQGKRVLEVEVTPRLLHEQRSWTTQSIQEPSFLDLQERIDEEMKKVGQRGQWPPYWARYTFSQ